jgi:pimeloyl-ACP methyl ester carboxylesterase
MHFYLLSGLGADERLFKYVDLTGFDVTNIHWPTPDRSDTMETYAQKLAPQITAEDPVLIGVSFGGMMAVELSKVVKAKKVILISSAACAGEVPALYKFAGKLRVHRLLTGAILKRSHRIMNWVMGAGDPIRRELLANMLRDTDARFLYWAIDKVVTWKNEIVPANVFRIHGTNDRVLPLRTAQYVIDKGGHIIVANRAKEVSAAIKEIVGG